MRVAMASQVAPPGGAVSADVLEENNTALLTEMQDVVNDQLAVRDEALKILQGKLREVRGSAAGIE